ncbi:MAG: tyrosine-type recombinase/integrase [Chitinophagales bacterium]|jgi:site-specific recombinase XerD|nr:phage integrase N-terminal SAM-like domain-containing protein [Sphingobacteriales bacterium]
MNNSKKRETCDLQLESQKFSDYLHLKGYSEQTIQSFVKTLSRFKKWLNMEKLEADEIGYKELLNYIKFIKNKGNGQRTQQHAMNVLKHYYRYLQKTEQILENPIQHVEIKSDKRKPLHSILSRDELELMQVKFKDYQPIKNSLSRQFGKNKAIKKRNEVILSLLIHQGLRTEEIAQLNLEDIQLREAKITIKGSRRTERRVIDIESSQLYLILDYLQEDRKRLLTELDKETNKLIFSYGTSDKVQNVFQSLLKALKKCYPKLQDMKQIRASVISDWLQKYNLRKAQYLAGHRYVSSTEAYLGNDISELQNNIKQYHPMG